MLPDMIRKSQICRVYQVQRVEANKKIHFVKERKLCNNCLKTDHFTIKWTSKNTCFKESCSVKHLTTLHDYFTQKKTSRE